MHVYTYINTYEEMAQIAGALARAPGAAPWHGEAPYVIIYIYIYIYVYICNNDDNDNNNNNDINSNTPSPPIKSFPTKSP